ncbi:hypothetical protein MMC25_003764 [Agyrium rufum]|nr:hypothetical protein [Agyrium rufum]
MNNSQFRKLVLDTPGGSNRNAGQGGATPRSNGAPTALGSRMRSSIPMTPRTVAGSSGVDFARQLREQNDALNPSAAKKFRSSAAPKGTKLASGYQDRTQQRVSEEADDKASRVKALEEQYKLGQIEQATFEALRDQIVGGDIKDVHLVKGLDWKLLERVRRGEDVLAEEKIEADEDVQDAAKEEPQVDIDEAFEDLEEKEVKPLAKEEKVKRGSMAPPPSVAGKKRTRDEILKELKASRLRAEEEKKAAQQPSLGSKFRKIGAGLPKSRIEKDERGREVLITVDENGKVKRKVRKMVDHGVKIPTLQNPSKDLKPLGMEVPDMPAPAPIKEVIEDIFEDAGDDYDPLGGVGGDDDDDDDDISSSEEGEMSAKTQSMTFSSSDGSPSLPRSPGEIPSSPNETVKHPPQDSDPSGATTPRAATDKSSMPPPPLPTKTPATFKPPPTAPSRNYFSTPSSSSTTNDDLKSSTTQTAASLLSDPTLLAALKKASSITLPSSGASDPSSISTSTTAEDKATAARHAALLASADRDAEDMDLDFGSSRFGDAEDMEADDDGGGRGKKKVKLSVWRGTAGGGGDNGDDDDDGNGDGEGGKGKARKDGGKRKRGPKKKKTGDKNSAGDVLALMERRKTAGK